MYQKYVKRILDCILSLVGLIMLSPIFLLLAIFIRVRLGSPVIFQQKRPGKDGKIFVLYKFRTMTRSEERRVGKECGS